MRHTYPEGNPNYYLYRGYTEKHTQTPQKNIKNNTKHTHMSNCVADRVRHDDGRQLRADAMFALRRRKTRKIFTNNIEKGRRASAFCWKYVNISWEKYTRQWFSGPMCPLDPWNVVNPFREMNGFFISGVYSRVYICLCVYPREHHGLLLRGLCRGRFILDWMRTSSVGPLLDEWRKSDFAICHAGVNGFFRLWILNGDISCITYVWLCDGFEFDRNWWEYCSFASGKFD